MCMHLCRFSLVGHDWGAALAWRMAGSLRGRVRQLVAISVGHPGKRSPGSAIVYERCRFAKAQPFEVHVKDMLN